MLPLVRLDIGGTLQATLARYVILLVRFVQVQIIINALPATQDSFDNQHPHQQHVLTLVRMGTGRTQQIKFARAAIFGARNAQVQIIISAPPATQDFFDNQHLQAQCVLTIVQLDMVGTLQPKFVNCVILLV